MSKQKGQLPKCFTCSEEAVAIARKKLGKMIKTLVKSSSCYFYAVNISDIYFGIERLLFMTMLPCSCSIQIPTYLI